MFLSKFKTINNRMQIVAKSTATENMKQFVGPLLRSIDAFIRTLMDEEAYHGEGGMGLQVTCRHGEPW